MKLQIIVGSTRQGRITDRAAKWVANEAEKMPGIEVEIVDLRDYPLPFFDEEISPQYNPDRQPISQVKKWLDKVTEADAYVLITPEYNRSTSAVLKNAIDYLDFQFSRKPVGLVAHGSTGGAQAVSHLRGILAGAQSFSAPNATYFSDRIGERIDKDGNLDENIKANPYGPQSALLRTLEEVKWYSDALTPAREREHVAA
jgi:NAD(P)H-dependent FMN reductase